MLRMPRVYVKGLKQRPGTAAGETCVADGCVTSESSSWSKEGFCAACRKKISKPLGDVTNKLEKRRSVSPGSCSERPIKRAAPVPEQESSATLLDARPVRACEAAAAAEKPAAPVPVPVPVGNDLLAMTLALSQARAQLEQERVISRRLLRAALERVVEHCERSGEDPDVAFVEAATGCTVAELQRVPTEKANRLGNLGFLIAPESRHFVGNPGMLAWHAAHEDATATFDVCDDWNEWDPEKRDTHYLPCEM